MSIDALKPHDFARLLYNTSAGAAQSEATKAYRDLYEQCAALQQTVTSQRAAINALSEQTPIPTSPTDQALDRACELIVKMKAKLQAEAVEVVEKNLSNSDPFAHQVLDEVEKQLAARIAAFIVDALAESI